jgi:hypothetical protein
MEALTPGLVIAVAGAGTSSPLGRAGYRTDGRSELYVVKSDRAGEVYSFDAHLDTAIVTSNALDWIGVTDDS